MCFLKHGSERVAAPDSHVSDGDASPAPAARAPPTDTEDKEGPSTRSEGLDPLSEHLWR